MYYVYAHINPSNNKPFYIGKGHGKRDRCTRKRNEHWNSIVDKYGFCIIRLADGLTNEQSLEIEKHYISKYGLTISGGILCNKTLGGDGGNTFDPVNNTSWNTGKRGIYKEESIAKMRNSRIGKRHNEKTLPLVLNGLKKANAASVEKRTLKVEDVISSKIWDSKHSCAKELGITVLNVKQRIFRNTQIKGVHLKFIKK